MGLWHRIQHVFVANCHTYIDRIEGEVWVVKECRRCGAELCRWFFKHQPNHERKVRQQRRRR